ncbi:hypothetical protein M8C21_006562 [Ambrosia artemisiifolia]|uniref:Uncharacterized protein n=1 Tax=Ambrosia artemisiifolia TaxID=4212 RepID=A0AAD5G788_AMBAR|nr:hypothetical protein M8C21_006562 [Ambrosia artemisiifolia]
MEDQTKKMEALKKAYAEMILNTAKEAAARVMASERKAVRVHHDLCNTKDEAVRMLIRFKQMIDVKKTEAETTALSRQKRIKELDEQLNETEGVIVDLRAEIRKAHERLEEMKNSRMLHSDRPSENEHLHQENTVTEHFQCSSPCSKSCNPAKEITKSDPNLASIIIGKKEPELYRNRYTHRIRAIERNVVDGNKISGEKELIINVGVGETNSGKHAASLIDTENKYTKNINGSEASSINSRISKDQTVRTRLPNKVKYARSNHILSRFCHEKLNLKKRSCGNVDNEKNACTLRRSVRKRKVRCWDEISSLFKSRAARSHFKGNNGVKSEETKHEETKLLNDSVAEKHLSAGKESVGTAPDADNNRCLKYSRRRKKVSSSEVYKPSYNLEHEKPTLIDDSSDSQNMIDVACQVWTCIVML